jgi:hypothetical protein
MAEPTSQPNNAREITVREHFRGQAAASDTLESPFTARLCRALADILDRNTLTGTRTLDWPGDPRVDALSLRLCGGLHAIVLSGDDALLAAAYPPDAADEETLRRVLPGAIARNDLRLATSLAGAPQTNEIARSGMLLPGLLLIARETGLPLALHEIGSSAGLNLLFDRFHYRYGEVEWGDPASAVRLQPELRGAAIPMDGVANVVSRKGSDIAPIYVKDSAGRLRLRSYIWPDQTARLERLGAAMALAAATPFELERTDAAAFVAKNLAARSPGSAFVLFHTIMWQYMPRATKDAILAALQEAGEKATADAPIARLRMEPRDPANNWAVLSLTLWPGGETRRLANCDFHGRWIEWIV